jgi:hypothetical protein
VRVTEAYVTLIPLTLPLSREGRGKRIIVKGINAFALVQSLEDVNTKNRRIYGKPRMKKNMLKP